MTNRPTELQRTVAQALLKIGAVGFKPDQPVTFKSGIVSPVYVDNRTFPFHSEEWAKVINGFGEVISKEEISFDVIAGIESAGIPHSAALGFHLKCPSVFVRKAVKDHGTKKRVEGGSVNGKKVLLIEDLVSTGQSSLSGVDAIRTEGGVVEDCLIIVEYGFPEAVRAFKEANVTVRSLTNFPTILEEALTQKIFDEKAYALIQDWFVDPHGWATRHNFTASA
jgi:orotate phosphoribosyltransferase